MTPSPELVAVANERADVGFFAIDPQRGADIAFTPPYVLIEGCYLVRDDSPVRDNAEVCRAGHVVVAGAGSAYDLHLARALQHATIVRAPTSQAVVRTITDPGRQISPRRTPGAARVRRSVLAQGKKTQREVP